MKDLTNTFDLATWSKVHSAWVLAEIALKYLNHVFLWGPPGVGKSYLASRAGHDPISVTLCEDLSVQELMGHWIPGQTWEFHYGPIALAFKEGRLLVINEISRASGSVHDFLLAVLDGHDVARFALPSTESLVPGPGFKVISTSNSAPDTLDPALRSRFEAEIYLPSPHPQLLERFDRDYPGLGKALANSFLDPERALDPRRLLSCVKLLEAGVPLRAAAGLSFGDSGPDVLAALSAGGVTLCDEM